MHARSVVSWEWDSGGSGTQYTWDDPRDWFGEWLFGRFADWWADQLDHRAVNTDNFDDFDPRDSPGYRIGPSTNGHRVYEGADANSWFMDLENDGTIDAHVVRDGMGDMWVDLGDGNGFRRDN